MASELQKVIKLKELYNKKSKKKFSLIDAGDITENQREVVEAELANLSERINQVQQEMRPACTEILLKEFDVLKKALDQVDIISGLQVEGLDLNQRPTENDCSFYHERDKGAYGLNGKFFVDTPLVTGSFKFSVSVDANTNKSTSLKPRW